MVILYPKTYFVKLFKYSFGAGVKKETFRKKETVSLDKIKIKVMNRKKILKGRTENRADTGCFDIGVICTILPRFILAARETNPQVSTTYIFK